MKEIRLVVIVVVGSLFLLTTPKLSSWVFHATSFFNYFAFSLQMVVFEPFGRPPFLPFSRLAADFLSVFMAPIRAQCSFNVMRAT